MDLDLPVWFEVGSFVVLGLILLFDLLYVVRRPHEPSIREASLWVTFYVALALVFGLAMLVFAGGTAAGEFYAGWLTEYSLSVDNLFVFIIIMARFAVPRKYQQEVLMIGIIMALVLRGIFILAGAALIERFVWIFYVFGLFLVYTAWRLWFQKEDDEYEENALIRRLRRVIPLHEEYDGNKLRTVVDGKKLWTPMIIVFAALASTDLLFAVDSIPAIFGLTTSPFIVFTANIFALMGLRQLYFLLGGLLNRLVYLSKGLSFILAFIGVKLVLTALHDNTLPFINGGEPVESVPEVPIWLSLLVIVGTMAVATLASLASSAGKEHARAAHQRDTAEREELKRESLPGEARRDGAEAERLDATESGTPVGRDTADEPAERGSGRD